jgi:hypothetical protein
MSDEWPPEVLERVARDRETREAVRQQDDRHAAFVAEGAELFDEIAPVAVTASPRKITARIMATTRLSLSAGTTFEASHLSGP